MKRRPWQKLTPLFTGSFWFPGVVLFPLGLFLSTPARAIEDWKADGSASQPLIETINVQTTGKFTKVIIQSSHALKYREILQEDPPALFLHMSTPTVSKRPGIQKVYGDLVEEIRLGYKGGALAPGDKALGVDYILFRLTEPTKYKIVQKDWVLVVELYPRGGQSIQRTRPTPGLDDTETYVPVIPKKLPKTLKVLPERPYLQDFLDVGLANNGSVQLAQAEYKLSKFRFFEASRALFPSVTGRYEESDGTLLLDPNDPTDDTDFRRREIGVQIGQPIFQSGRLYYSLRQASIQKRIGAQNIKKARADATFEIIRAYYNLIKAQRALQARRELVERGEKIRQLTEKKKQLEIVTETEALGVESQYSQLYYRMLSDEKDLQLAHLRIQALLNTPEPIPDDVPEPPDTLDMNSLADVKVPVEGVVEQAMRNRPEMIIADYTARFQSYGEKAAKAEGRLRLDVSGFVGKSGGAFSQAESLRLRSSWNIGAQAHMLFAGNSLRGAGTGEKTSPDLGETSRTETRAQSANVGLLDGLRVISDRKQATILKERAAMEQEQIRRNVDLEVREAIFNIEKAKLQLKGAQYELNYRQKEAAIARQRERMNLIDPTQTLAAESTLTEAVVAYEEAVAFYRVALASFEKAVGLALDSLQEVP